MLAPYKVLRYQRCGYSLLHFPQVATKKISECRFNNLHHLTIISHEWSIWTNELSNYIKRKKKPRDLLNLVKEEDDGGRNWAVARSQNLTVCIDEGDAPFPSEIQMKQGFSRLESSTGKSTTFKLTVTAITAVSCHNYHRDLELIGIRW